jgi:hypothetical protein
LGTRQQVPAQAQQARPDRLEEQFDRLAFAHGPFAREPKRPQMDEVDLLCRQHVFGEAGRQAVAMARLLDLPHHRIDPAPHFGRCPGRLEGEGRLRKALGKTRGVAGQAVEHAAARLEEAEA